MKNYLFTIGVVVGAILVSEVAASCPNITGVAPCTHFSLCLDGITTTLACPDGLLYNNDTLQCDYSYNVNATTCTNATSTGSPTVCTDGAIRVTPSSACASFDVCVFNNWTYTIPCPAGTLFRETYLTCYPEHFINTTTCDTYAPVCSNGETRATIGSSCTEFNMCVDGIWSDVNTTCPTDTLFNGDLQICDFAANVNTSSCANKTSSGSNCTSGATRVSPASSCTQFQMCVNGEWSDVNNTCPANTLYNEDLQLCGHEANVNTSSCTSLVYSGVDCTGVNYTTPITAPGDCSSFYYCDGESTPIQYNCSSPLLFNRNVSFCDNPSVVDSTTCYQISL